MRIPKYYRRVGWQRFIAGIFFGFVGGWVLFIILSGAAHEQQLQKIDELKTKIESLREENNDLKKDEKRKNQELQRRLTVQETDIFYAENETSKKLGKGDRLKLEKMIIDQLASIRNSDVDTVGKNRGLIYLIENEDYVIDDNHYKIEIEELFLITSTLEITITVEQTN